MLQRRCTQAGLRLDRDHLRAEPAERGDAVADMGADVEHQIAGLDEAARRARPSRARARCASRNRCRAIASPRARCARRRSMALGRARRGASTAGSASAASATGGAVSSGSRPMPMRVSAPADRRPRGDDRERDRQRGPAGEEQRVGNAAGWVAARTAERGTAERGVRPELLQRIATTARCDRRAPGRSSRSTRPNGRPARNSVWQTT